VSTLRKIKRALRGEVKLTTAALEAVRRARASSQQRKERANLDREDPLALCSPDRETRFFPVEIGDDVLPSANQLIDRQFEWNRDPRSGYLWPLDYHRDITLMRSDGSDVRIVWELNRLGHLITLGRAYTSTRDQKYTTAFLQQLRSWSEANPYGRGPNWTCAMEVALRAVNLIVARELFRNSSQLDTQFLLRLFQQHGNYIRRNLEFSFIATSNHYLSDVAGLLWLGVMVPELRDANAWRDFGLKELLREMDKQVLPDGADFESSTGYHRFVTELFLYSFLLCRENGIAIQQRYWDKLRAMLLYTRAYLRPDGFAPLIGDTDGGQFLPLRQHRADDHAYLLAIGADAFDDPTLRDPQINSIAFPHAGTYIMRRDDLYLCFNASGAGIKGRGSHAHNDKLSIEVSAGSVAFIVDPGTYVYTGDLQRRHEFRSTAYHSTVKIDGVEQNTIERNAPFVIGDEARPRVLLWETNADSDKIVAEHYGYRRLKNPVIHRRTVIFNKPERSWLIEDEFLGDAVDHDFEVRFHFAPGLKVNTDNTDLEIRDSNTDLTLHVRSLSLSNSPVLEQQFTSRNYGEMNESVTACWRFSGPPQKLSWKLSL
jgi:heparinase II/III-like protein